MTEIYQKFVQWKNEQVPGYIETRLFTGGEAEFAEYFLDLVEKDPQFKKMLTEVGPKLEVFKQIHTFYRDQRGSGKNKLA